MARPGTLTHVLEVAQAVRVAADSHAATVRAAAVEAGAGLNPPPTAQTGGTV
jgi:hypothetical protein